MALCQGHGCVRIQSSDGWLPNSALSQDCTSRSCDTPIAVFRTPTSVYISVTTMTG
jgi:hypothetical protein